MVGNRDRTATACLEPLRTGSAKMPGACSHITAETWANWHQVEEGEGAAVMRATVHCNRTVTLSTTTKQHKTEQFRSPHSTAARPVNGG